jgi:hypothetical protein
LELLNPHLAAPLQLPGVLDKGSVVVDPTFWKVREN